MLKVYGTEICPDCVACKKGYDGNGVAYEYVDIFGSLRNLKEFLHLRDTLPLYDEVKARGAIGIPTVVTEEGEVSLDWEKFLDHKGNEKTAEVPAGAACGLDGKGC